jgi:hypothetical protein
MMMVWGSTVVCYGVHCIYFFENSFLLCGIYILYALVVMVYVYDDKLM